MYSVFFLFNQKTAYEMRISDWSSDVCSSDLSGGSAMHSLFAFLSLAAWSVQAAAAPAAAPAKAWPHEVQAAYDDLKTECRASGGKFIADSAAFATETELTNDGKSDWVLEYAATRCSNAGYSAWCGTAGCMI